jgi:hypothetical protein
VNALKDGRVLVAGKISQDLVRRVLDGNDEVDKFSIPHPCRWPWVWGAPILAKLRSVIGDSMPNEERFAKILIHALSQAVIARWMRMTRWEREAFSLQRKAAYAALRPEEKERRAEAASAAYTALQPEEKERRAEAARARWMRMTRWEREAFSLQRKAAYAALQPEEKERRAEAASAAYTALQPEEKERRAEAARASMCMYWHHAGPIEKLQRVQAMHTYRNTVAGKKAWRAALRAARGRMMPETRVAVFSAMRAGYRRKMTPARQAEIGTKKREAWTLERRIEAAARGKANADIYRKSISKAHEALRQPECMEKRNRARRETTAQATKKRVLAALEKKGTPLDKKERRSLRESCQKALAAVDAGRLSLSQEETDLFRKGMQLANVAGAESKSAKLRCSRD